jgi:hypothetical protein
VSDCGFLEAQSRGSQTVGAPPPVGVGGPLRGGGQLFAGEVCLFLRNMGARQNILW